MGEGAEAQVGARVAVHYDVKFRNVTFITSRCEGMGGEGWRGGYMKGGEGWGHECTHGSCTASSFWKGASVLSGQFLPPSCYKVTHQNITHC